MGVNLTNEVFLQCGTRVTGGAISVILFFEIAKSLLVIMQYYIPDTTMHYDQS